MTFPARWTSPTPKPAKGGRKRVAAKQKRSESAVAKAVRAACVERDGYCRVPTSAWLGPHGGPSEWAHLGDGKRFKTRGMAPADRHSTRLSLMLCRRHHAALDASVLAIIPITAAGADEALRFRCGEDDIWAADVARRPGQGAE